MNVLEGTLGTGRGRLGKEKPVTREALPDWRVEERRLIRSCVCQQAWDPWSQGQQAGALGRGVSPLGLLARGGAARAHRLPVAGAVWTGRQVSPGSCKEGRGCVRPPGHLVLLVWLREGHLSFLPGVLFVGNIICGMFWTIEVAEIFGDTVVLGCSAHTCQR